MPDTSDSKIPVAQPGDPFFILRDCRALFVRRLAEIARQSGIHDAGVLDAMEREIGAVHDELASTEAAEGFAGTRGLTASRISLVGHDDLELDIRIGEIASHLRDDETIDHWRAQLRYMTLLGRPGMTPDDNPVGMEPIRRGLWILCRESGGGLDRQFDRLQRVEEMLKLKLPEVYLEVNQLLESRGVQPAPVQLVRPAGSTRAQPQTGPGGQGSIGTDGNALAALQQTMQRQLGSDMPLAGAFPGGGAGSAGGNFAADASAMVMLNHLLERLDLIERQQYSAALPAATGGDAESNALRPLRSGDLDLPAGKPTAIVLDTLSLIFEAIFASPDLPDVVKTLLGRLQIPLLKKAILDPQFFADMRHPARQFVNRLARVSLGLPTRMASDHPLCRKLAEIADAARPALESRDGNLAPHLDALDTLIVRRDEAIQGAAQAYIDQVHEYERGEVALASAQDWLQETLTRTREPAFVQFLSVHWVRLMQEAGFTGGTGGDAWKEGAATIDDLLWSIQPKPTPEERQKLTAAIPTLIRKINAGLDRIAVPQEQRASFLDACFALQTAVLRGKPAGGGTPLPSPSPRPLSERTPAPAIPGAFPAARILERDGKRVQYLGRPNTPASPWRTGGETVKAGDWLAFAMPDGQALCGRICWQGPESRTFLLFNPKWGYAVALAPSIIEQQLESGKARRASAVSLFDAAAEQALGRLRGESN